MEPFEQFAVAPLVEVLDLGDHLEGRGHILETFVGSHLSEVVVEVAPFEALALGGFEQIFGRGAYASGRIFGGDGDHAPLQEVEETGGVGQLLFGRFGKDGSDLFISFLLRLPGKEGVAVTGLRLAGKGFEQVLFGLGSLNRFHHGRLLFVW